MIKFVTVPKDKEFFDVLFWRNSVMKALNSVIPYGSMYAYDANATISIALTGKANKVQVTTFDTNGVSNYITPDYTNAHMVIEVTGDYFVSYSIACATANAGVGYLMGFSVFINNGATEIPTLHAHHFLSGVLGDLATVTVSGIASFTKDDTVEIWVWNETNDKDIIIDDISMSMRQVG